jgi:polyhydroxybutyrate depolymerase
MQKWLGFDEFADQYGFVVIYPHSPDGQWDAGAGVLELGTSERTRRDDTGYIVKIIEEVAETYSLDREKVFVVGISDGASMAFRLSCKFDGTFAGLASVAATIPVYANKNCATAKPLSALFIHGKQDTVLPWDGIIYRGIRIYLSLKESVDWWLSRNGCDAQDGDRRYQPYVGRIERWQVKHCQNNTEVVVYRVNDGGHSWPMRDHPEGRTTGHVNRDMDATVIVVEWLMAH